VVVGRLIAGAVVGTAQTARAALEALLADAPRIEKPEPGPDSPDGAEDPRWLGYFLLAMARETLRVAEVSKASEPPSSLVRQLEADLRGRPSPNEAHGQLVIDAVSVARRATLIAAYAAMDPGPIVAIGDDDGVSLALALLGQSPVHVFDVDERVLAFLSETAASRGVEVRAHLADVFEDTVPDALRHRAAAVVTDPFRSAEDAAPFLAFGLSMMRREDKSWLFLCDHADWNFDHVATLAMLVGPAGAGLVEVAHKRALHRYPLEIGLFPHFAEAAEAIGVSIAWLEALLSLTSAWSDLFIFERRPR
jgi:hypothetical protein